MATTAAAVATGTTMSSPASTSKGKASVLCTAATAFKKKPGQLTLTKAQLIWNIQGSDKPDGELSFDNARLNCEAMELDDITFVIHTKLTFR